MTGGDLKENGKKVEGCQGDARGFVLDFGEDLDGNVLQTNENSIFNWFSPYEAKGRKWCFGNFFFAHLGSICVAHHTHAFASKQG